MKKAEMGIYRKLARKKVEAFTLSKGDYEFNS